jgi:hypothetical protein
VWIENFDRKLYVNGVALDETWTTQMTLQTSPISSPPYGFWRNDSSVVIATSDWLYMEKTALIILVCLIILIRVVVLT